MCVHEFPILICVHVQRSDSLHHCMIAANFMCVHEFPLLILICVSAEKSQIRMIFSSGLSCTRWEGGAKTLLFLLKQITHARAQIYVHTIPLTQIFSLNAHLGLLYQRRLPPTALLLTRRA